jgi:aspartyl/asparaginyl beta-hydroxylase (cupin superfamily)|tara:strand:+ start:273 stop:749 length:477 start_codon:yes stop_codon:yes gene_type:complete
MITKSNLKELYKWASSTEFPLKKAPTTVGYSNKDIYICGLKYIRKNVNIRKSKMTNTIYNIMKNDEILYAVYSRFEGGTILKPHKDPDVYSDRYKRVQIPLNVTRDFYMMWKDRKIYWENGVTQVFEVMDNIHQAFNNSDKTMEFLFLDVKISTKVEL